MEVGPIIALAAALFGLITGEHIPLAGANAFFVLGAAGIAAAFMLHARVRVVIAAVAFVLLGCAVMQRALDGQRVSPLTSAIATRADVELHGVLTSDPDDGPFTTTALVRVEVGGTHRTLLLSAPRASASPFRVLQAGDHVVVGGRLGPLHTNATDVLARWRHAVGRLDNAELLTLAPPSGLLAVADSLRSFVLRGTTPLAPTPRAVLAGFLLGDTRGIPSSVIADYRNAGLSHLLAVSGENVAFVLALVAPVLRRLRLGARTIVALAVVVLFAAMTRFEPSVLRATAMAAIALLATFAGRPASRVRVLAYAMIVLLLVDPFLLHSVGFWLSCSACAGIALLEPAFASHLRVPQFVREPLAVSLAAQVGVLPVLLIAFGTFPLVTPLTNVLAAPAAQLLGVYGFVASALTNLAPPFGPLVQQPTRMLIAWIDTVAHAGGAVPLQLDRGSVLAIGSVLAMMASVACLRVGRAVPESASRRRDDRHSPPGDRDGHPQPDP